MNPTGRRILISESEHFSIPELASKVLAAQDEPFGGVPTLGMAKVYERAKQESVSVLLDANGIEEGWAGYEFYQDNSFFVWQRISLGMMAP